MDLLERLIESRPQFHGWPDGRVADWSLSAEALRHLRASLEPGMCTLETGAGASTVVFAITSTHHVCITPDRAEAERINAYCAREGIAHDITFIHEPSERALPACALVPERLDFVLIDGAHRFPLPMLDWHYTEARVPPGGVIAVDDIQLPSVRILSDFLAGEDEWALARTVGTTAFFRRLSRTVLLNDWQGQRINQAQRARGPKNPRELLRRWIR
jgi:hypothetical protein